MSYKLKQLFSKLTKRERLGLFFSFLIFVVSAISWGAYLVKTRTINIPAYGGVWTEASIEQPVFINPVLSHREIDQDLSALVFASLNDLAYEIKTENYKDWTVRLNENNKWHDGAKITSDDIVFTINTISDPQISSHLANKFLGSSVERVSELEVKIKLPTAYVFFEKTLRDLRPIPKHLFETIPPANFGESALMKEPIGSGPYRYHSYKKNKDGFIREYNFLSYKNYLKHAPNISKINFRFYAREDEIISAYNRGLIDAFTTFNPKTLEKITARKTAYPLPITNYYAVFFNPALNSFFKDKTNRSVLANNISKKEIVDNVFRGLAKEAYGPMFNIPQIASEAKLISPANIILTIPDITYDDTISKMAEVIKKDWEKLGLTVTIEALSGKDIQEKIKNRSYEAILFGNILQEPQDLYPLWHSSKRFSPGLNLSMFSNEVVDHLLEDIRLTPYKEKRQSLAENASMIIRDEAPATFIVFPQYTYILSPHLKGFDLKTGSLRSDRFNDIYNWYLVSLKKLW